MSEMQENRIQQPAILLALTFRIVYNCLEAENTFLALYINAPLCWTPSLHWPTLGHKLLAWGHSESPTPHTQTLALGMEVLSSVQWNLNTTVGQVA